MSRIYGEAERVVGGAPVTYTPVGAHNSVVGAGQGLHAPSWDLMCRILYRFLTLLARLAVRSGRSKELINEYRRAT